MTIAYGARVTKTVEQKQLGREVTEWPELEIRVGGCGDNNYSIVEPTTEPVLAEPSLPEPTG